MFDVMCFPTPYRCIEKTGFHPSTVCESCHLMAVWYPFTVWEFHHVMTIWHPFTVWESCHVMTVWHTFTVWESHHVMSVWYPLTVCESHHVMTVWYPLTVWESRHMMVVWYPLTVWLRDECHSSLSFQCEVKTSFCHSVICLVSVVCISVATLLWHGWVAGPVHNLPLVASYNILKGALELFFLPSS